MSRIGVGVTGMAWTTALGRDLATVWERLLKGETGLVPVPHTGKLRNNLGAIVADVPLTLPAHERLSIMALDTLSRALWSAGHGADRSDVMLVAGTSFGSYIEDDPPEPSAHVWADRLAEQIGSRWTPIVVSTACSAGADAIAVGAELIRRGQFRTCVCGGVDVLTLSKRLSHSALGTLSPSMLRAFDTRHDGTLLGEGAAFLVLQALDERARPLAIYRGSGMANDAAGMTAPDVTGGSVCLAIERSLSDAELTAEDIRLVNAHGSGTLLNDQTEREALQRAFPGTAKPAVFATKGNFGHSLGATGAIEAMALLLAMRHANVPPIVALEQPDPAFALPLPVGRILDWPAPFGLSLTLGFGGFDTSLVFEVPS